MPKIPNNKPVVGDVMKSAVEQERSFFQFPKRGDIVEGPIIAREGSEVYIDLGPRGTGIIYGREFYASQDKLKDKKKGDLISAKIVEIENEDGLRELSLSEAGRETSWQKVQRMKGEQELITVKIVNANRGGLMIEKEGIEGFLPVSQLAPAHYPRVEGGDKEKILRELQQFVGQTMEVRVLDVDQRQNKFIVSEKAGEQEAIKKALEKYKVGDEAEGEITGVVEFGAFIRLDPLVEGLVHISELDWQLVQDPHDIVKVGDKIKAKIVDISPDG
ncbi:MAG: S1 RNA-binding domain-containing protein, partial [Deltaproteobacteria bacterium]